MEYNLRTVPVYSALANAFAYFKEHRQRQRQRQRQHLATFTRTRSTTFVCSDKEKVLPANILSPFASWHRVLKRLTQTQALPLCHMCGKSRQLSLVAISVCMEIMYQGTLSVLM